MRWWKDKLWIILKTDICIHIFQIFAEPYSPRAKIISPFVLRIEIVFFIDGKQKYSGSHQKKWQKTSHIVQAMGGQQILVCEPQNSALFEKVKILMSFLG